LVGLFYKEEYERMNKALEERLDKPYKTISHKDMLKASERLK